MPSTAAAKTFRSVLFYAGAILLSAPQVFVFAWMIMTGLKTGVPEHQLPAGVRLHAHAREFPGGLPAAQFPPLPLQQPGDRGAGDLHLACARAAGGLLDRQVPAGQDRHADPARADDPVRELPAAVVHHLPLPEADRHLHGADAHAPDHHAADGGLADGGLLRKRAGGTRGRGHDRRLLARRRASSASCCRSCATASPPRRSCRSSSPGTSSSSR